MSKWEQISTVIYKDEGREDRADTGSDLVLELDKGERHNDVANKLIVGLVRHGYFSR